MYSRQWCCALVLGAATPALAQPVVSAPYPVKPIRMIVPFPPGGGNDLLARTVSQRLAEVVNQQVIVDNRGGAGGALGAQLAITAAPDGYTVFLGSVGNLAQNPLLQEKPINWQGIAVPAKTPAPIVQTLHGKLSATLKMPGMNEMMHALALDAAGAGPEEFAALMKSEIAKYGKVVKAAGIRAD
jgi:tripartite-type tricarboxylate transporter receptor subunit TctC